MFLINYYEIIKNQINDRIQEIKNNELIINLKKFSVFLIIFNFMMITFNILSPVELKIFFDKNIILNIIIYIILCIYAIIYIVYWGIQFYHTKKKFR